MTGFSALPLAEEGRDDNAQWAGVSRIMGPRWAHLPTLTIGLLGCQVLWSVEMSYASPYLLSLGLTKSWMAAVFLAGPLSGLIVQPLVGVLADHSRSRFGRRRPYMIGGSVLCLLAMLLLGYTRPVATIFTPHNTSANDILTIWLAVLSIYCVDFSINAVQAVDRALLVDTLPASKQAAASAWAARMLGVGSVAGFFVGNVNLVRWFPMFGSEQLEVLSVIASFLLLSTHALTAYFVKEKILLSSTNSEKGFRQEFKAIFSNLFTLPRVIRQICIVQFFAWIGWFPVLFYATVYVGELHKRASLVPDPTDTAAVRALEAEATRLGSRALLYSSLLSLGANIILPFFVREATQRKPALSPLVANRTWRERFQVHLGDLWTVSHLVFALCMGATFFTTSVSGATLLITVTGFSWAVALWAPFTLLAEAILTEHGSVIDAEDAGSIRLADSRTREEQQFLVADDPEDDERSISPPLDGDGDRARGRLGVMGNPTARLSQLDMHATNGDLNGEDDARRSSSEGLSAKAGVILGISNVFVVIPQFIVTGMSSIIFAIFEPDKSVLHGNHPGKINPVNGTAANESSQDAALTSLQRQDSVKEGVNSIALIFQLGGIASMIAFVLCWRLMRELRHR